MKVKIKKLEKGVITPTKGSKGAVAYDLVLNDNVTIPEGRSVIPLGFCTEIPYGIEGKIEARSGHSSKGMLGIDICYGTYTEARYNCDVIPGKLDPDYRGQVGVIVNNHDVEFMINAGTAIAQLTFYKVEDVDFEEVEELSDTERGEGGFGSTRK